MYSGGLNDRPKVCAVAAKGNFVFIAVQNWLESFCS
jgi:hypothetical protein